MSKTNAGNFFEDFQIGQVIKHATPRTITYGDQTLYTALYGSRFAVQSSDAFARALGYAHAPVDDLLTFHVVFGKTVPDIAKKYRGTDGEGRLADPDLRTRIVKHEMDQRAFALTLRRAALEAKGNAGPSAATSIMKNVGARITQDRAELNIEIMGMQGLGWEGEGFSEEELSQTRSWLWGKAVSIYGGSSEIQNNIVAKRILGMLDHQ